MACLGSRVRGVGLRKTACCLPLPQLYGVQGPVRLYSCLLLLLLPPYCLLLPATACYCCS